MQLATENISLNLKHFIYTVGVSFCNTLSLCIVRGKIFFFNYTSVVQTTQQTVEKKLYFVVTGPLTVNHLYNVPVVTKLVP